MGAARILLVEDQDTIRELVRAILVTAGHDVVVALNGAEAVAAVRDAGFDLILMDVHMPVMDGRTAARQIRALGEARAKIPIIAISGDAHSGAASGMDDHMCKPFRKAELLLKVAAWLKGGLAPPPAALREASEASAFGEACDLMGRPWAARGLAKLKVQIDEAFGPHTGSAHPRTARNDGQLAGRAHALVSLSALLGFATLSDLCSTLEEACRSGHDVQPPFEAARAAAADARQSATGLIAGLARPT